MTLLPAVEKFYLRSAKEDRSDLNTETMIVDEEELECIDRMTGQETRTTCLFQRIHRCIDANIDH